MNITHSGNNFSLKFLYGNIIFRASEEIMKCISIFSITHNSLYWECLLSGSKFRLQVIDHYQAVV